MSLREVLCALWGIALINYPQTSYTSTRLARIAKCDDWEMQALLNKINEDIASDDFVNFNPCANLNLDRMGAIALSFVTHYLELEDNVIDINPERLRRDLRRFADFTQVPFTDAIQFFKPILSRIFEMNFNLEKWNETVAYL